eukprot:2293368-Pyramimonas_sp.AAC.1
MFDEVCENIPFCAVRVARSRERVCVCVCVFFACACLVRRPVCHASPVHVCYRRVPLCPRVLSARAGYPFQHKSPTASLPVHKPPCYPAPSPPHLAHTDPT